MPHHTGRATHGAQSSAPATLTDTRVTLESDPRASAAARGDDMIRAMVVEIDAGTTRDELRARGGVLALVGAELDRDELRAWPADLLTATDDWSDGGDAELDRAWLWRLVRTDGNAVALQFFYVYPDGARVWRDVAEYGTADRTTYALARRAWREYVHSGGSTLDMLCALQAADMVTCEPEMWDEILADLRALDASKAAYIPVRDRTADDWAAMLA